MEAGFLFYMCPCLQTRGSYGAGADPGEMAINTMLLRSHNPPVTRMPINPGGINGGFYQKTPDMTSACPSVVIAADDVEASVKDTMDAGGKVLGEPMDIPGVGAHVSFIDTEETR